MAGYVGLVDQAIQGLLDQCEREGEFDLMTSFASPLPIAVVTHLLGLPNDPERLRRLGSTIARALDGIWSLGQARTLATADAELRTTFAELLDRRRADPRDDLVSALVAEQGRDITPRRLRNHGERDRQRHALAAG
jgi:cytochrome P450